MLKYRLPDFLDGVLSREEYVRWLDRTASAHTRRDRRRFDRKIERKDYKEAIHEAALRSDGCDEYTGHPLDWGLIGQYDNDQSKEEGASYKKEFANLPTVDHEEESSLSTSFRICSWQVNDCKSDLSINELIELVDLIKRHNRRSAGQDHPLDQQESDSGHPFTSGKGKK